MKASQNLFITLAALSLIGTSVGCYTMLKHPRVQSDDRAVSAQEGEPIGFTDDCSGCHNLSSLHAYHPVVPPPRRVVSSSWSHYYDDPWWIPYYTPAVPGGSAAQEEEQQKKRPFDRRHLSRPDESNPSTVAAPEPASNPGTIAKPADSGSSQPAPPPQDSGKREEKRSGDSSKENRRTRKPNN